MERFWDLLNKVAIVLGIAPVFVSALVNQPWLPLAYAIYICLLNISLIGYIAYFHREKRHRYAEIVQFLHRLNHAIRDKVAGLHLKQQRGCLNAADYDDAFKGDTLSFLLDQIAASFSHISGVRCSVCIKELIPDRRLHVIARDSMSATDRPIMAPPHSIDDDTPCLELYEPKEPKRYYICNDVVRAWRNQEYNSSSFDIYGAKKPEIVEYGPYYRIRYWPLKYRSCLVLPIRYTPTNGSGSTAPHKIPCRYWGFLCIDSEHRGIFSQKSWEVGAMCADALYCYSSTINAILEGETKPSTN